MDYDSLLELVQKRRSIRQFKPDPVPDEYIDKIIEVARWAPSGFHTQPWEFVVVKKKEVKDKIADVLDRYYPLIRAESKSRTKQALEPVTYKDAPVFIILLGDWRAKVGLPDMVQKHDERVTPIFLSSLASTFVYMHLAAAALGLASQWRSGAGFAEPECEIKKIIGIPEDLKIYDMMVLGYAARVPIPKVVRNREDMVHYDDCGIEDFRTAEEVVACAKKTKAWCTAAH